MSDKQIKIVSLLITALIVATVMILFIHNPYSIILQILALTIVLTGFFAPFFLLTYLQRIASACISIGVMAGLIPTIIAKEIIVPSASVGEFVLDNSPEVSIGAFILAGICIVLDTIFPSTEKKNNTKSKFKIRLEDSYRITFKDSDKLKLILFNVSIINQSHIGNSFTAYLEITYYNQTGETNTISLNHNPKLRKKAPQKELPLLQKNIIVQEKNVVSGWLIFEQPERLSTARIDKYVIRLRDVDDKENYVEAYLIKDILHEV